MSIIVLKVDSQQELHHDQGKIDPKRRCPIKLVLRVDFTEDPNEDADCRCRGNKQVDHVDVLERKLVPAATILVFVEDADPANYGVSVKNDRGNATCEQLEGLEKRWSETVLKL